MSLEEKIDTSSAAGELVFHAFGAIARFEKRLIAEHTTEGLNAVRLKGKFPGRPLLNKETLQSARTLVETGNFSYQSCQKIRYGQIYSLS